MKRLVIAASILGVSCTGRSGNMDSATARDSVTVAGPAAVPSALTPPVESATATTPGTPARPTDLAKTVPPSPVPAGERVDSVRGVVSVVGTSFERRVMVAVAGTNRRVEITGRLASLIGHVAGADVSVAGNASGSQLDATSFLVRAVDGQPAIDGTLKTETDGVYILSAGGTRTRITAPPPPLKGRDGARVWVTGDPARGVSSFGFIDPPR